jgi:hypothetical protein
MKKFLLNAFIGGVCLTASAQVPNGGFENWKTDTSILNITQQIILNDTFSFEDPLNWTSVNYITGADTFLPGTPGGVIMVTKSTNAHSGNFAARIETQNITIPLIGLQTAIPGFVISGEFKISVSNLLGSGGFSPTSLPGSGITVSGRLDSFSVYANYTPVTGDSALLVAVLRKGTNVVATAAQFIKASTNGYKKFTAPFVYSECDVPDSVTFALSSSNLFELQSLVGSLGSGTLAPGSVLLVDDVSFTNAPNNYIINPIARQDDTIMVKNTSITVNVLANDQDCNPNGTLSLGNISTTTAHGSATKSGNNITYTPINNYVGFDTVFYELVSSAGKSSTGILRIRITDPSSVNDLTMVRLFAFPNPTNTVLKVRADVQNAVISVSDVSGRKVLSEVFNGFAALPVAELSVGTYFVHILNEQGAIVGKTKFFIAK